MENINQHHSDYSNFQFNNREENLKQLIISYNALSTGQNNWVCNLSNASSLLWYTYKSLPLNINWAGFYVTDKNNDQTLMLGPFQGKVACQSIQFNKGVCGAAAFTRSSQIVNDVNKFPGHIACDGETKSEIVVPIIQGSKCVGVIDIDCIDYNGFDELDEKYLRELADMISKTCVF